MNGKAYVPITLAEAIFKTPPLEAFSASMTSLACRMALGLVFFFVLLVDELNDGYRLLLSNHQKLLNLLEKPYPSILDPIVDRINVLLQKNTFSLSSFSASRLEGFVRFAISQTSAVLGSFGWFVINFIVMIFCMFFLFRDGHFLFARFQLYKRI